MHIIKWESQPEKKSVSWKKTINNLRNQINDFQNKRPSLTDDFLKQNWDKTYTEATKKAEKEMEKESEVSGLTWQQVFFNKYTLIILVLIMIGWLVL